MRRSITLFTLYIFLCLGNLSDARQFDVEAFASLDELAAALTERVTDTLHRDAGASVPAAKRKIRLAIVPVDIRRSDIVPGLVRAMNASGRVSSADPAKTAAFVKALPPDRDSVAELGREFGVDAVAAVRGYPSGDSLLVLVRIFRVGGGERPETIAALLAASHASGGLEGISRDTRPVAEMGLPELPLTARYFRAADLDADGAREYVFSDENTLSVYRLEAQGWRSVRVGPRMPKAREGRHVYLDVADIDDNGTMEIFVTVMSGREVFSLVFEEERGTFRQKAEIPGFVRVLSIPGQGPVLLGQGHQEDRMFDGEVRQYRWRGGGYAAGDIVALPQGVNLYGFVAADFGEAHPLIAAFDREDRLCIYSRGELIWKSEERYFNSDTVLVEATADVYNIGQRVSIPVRILTADIDGNGTDEIIIARITGKSLSGDARKAEVQCLRWTGARLETVLTIQDVPGAILDFQIEHRQDDALLIEALLKTRKSIFSRPGARMTTYLLNGR